MSSPIDFAVLQELANNDPAKVRKFALLFIKSMQEVLDLVDTALATGDLEQLGNLGHRAKSTAMTLGATEFSGQWLLLEKTARAQDPAALALAHTLRGQFAPVHAVLDAYLADNPAV